MAYQNIFRWSCTITTQCYEEANTIQLVLPRQLMLSRVLEYGAIQSQIYEPIVLKQSCSHISVSLAHSSRSKDVSIYLHKRCKVFSFSPLHVRSSKASLYPLLQEHEYEPLLLVHKCSQKCIPLLHSSRSFEDNKYD